MKNDLVIFPSEIAVESFQELYQAVFNQLNKDFHPYASLTHSPQPLSSEWLFSEVKRMLSSIIEKENSALGYIIYRVDIPEKTMLKAMHGLIGEEKMDALALLILRREAQKVWIRKMWSE